MRKILFFILCATVLCCFNQNSNAQCAAGETAYTVLIDLGTGGTGNTLTDVYPNEIYWNITDASGSIVASAACGSYTGLSGLQTVPVCLPTAGAPYTFNAFDDWGDGWNGLSNVSITTSAGQPLVCASIPNNGEAGDGADGCTASAADMIPEASYTFDSSTNPGTCPACITEEAFSYVDLIELGISPVPIVLCQADGTIDIGFGITAYEGLNVIPNVGTVDSPNPAASLIAYTWTLTQADIDNAPGGIITLTLDDTNNTFACDGVISIDVNALGISNLDDFCNSVCGDSQCTGSESYCTCVDSGGDCGCETSMTIRYFNISSNTTTSAAGNQDQLICYENLFDAIAPSGQDELCIVMQVSPLVADLACIPQDGLTLNTTAGTIYDSLGVAINNYSIGELFFLCLDQGQANNPTITVNVGLGADANCSVTSTITIADYLANDSNPFNDVSGGCPVLPEACSSQSGSTLSATNICDLDGFAINLANCVDATMNNDPGSIYDPGFVIIYDTDPTTIPTDAQLYDAILASPVNPPPADLVSGFQTSSCDGTLGNTDFQNIRYPFAICQPVNVSVYLVPIDFVNSILDTNCPIGPTLGTITINPNFEIITNAPSSCTPIAYLAINLGLDDMGETIYAACDSVIAPLDAAGECTGDANYNFDLGGANASCVVGNPSGTVTCQCAVCEITSSGLVVSDCTDANPPTIDITDDTFTFSINPSNSLPNTAGYVVTGGPGTIVNNVGNYGTATTLGPFTISSWLPSNTITICGRNDDGTTNTDCCFTETVTPPADCSPTCGESTGSTTDVTNVCSGGSFILTPGSTTCDSPNGFTVYYVTSGTALTNLATAVGAINCGAPGSFNVPANATCDAAIYDYYLVPNNASNTADFSCLAEGPIMITVSPNYSVSVVDNTCAPFATLSVDGTTCDTQGSQGVACTGGFGIDYNFSATVGSSTCIAGPVSGSLTCNPITLADATICTGGSTVLDAGPGYASYSWSTGETTQMITVATAGDYTVTVDGICSATATVSVGGPNEPQPDPVSYCAGASALLTGPAGYASYSWSTGQSDVSIAVIAGTYDLTITDALGCPQVLTYVVTETPLGGCADPAACNFDDTAVCGDQASCIFEITCDEDPCTGGGVQAWNATNCACEVVTPTVVGCIDPAACNFDETANCDNSTCIFETACDVDPCTNGGTYVWSTESCSCVLDVATVSGCTDATACNFNAAANCDDDSCLPVPTCNSDICAGDVSVVDPNNPCQCVVSETQVLGCMDATACNFNAAANCDDSSCLPVPTCNTDICAGDVTIVDPANPCQCILSVAQVLGCTEACAPNFDSTANCDDGSCMDCIEDCGDPTACNFNDMATVINNDLCDYGNTACTDPCAPVSGCTDAAACNFDTGACVDDGSCIIETACDDDACTNGGIYTWDADICACALTTPTVLGCDDSGACNFNPDANCDDGSCIFEIACNADPCLDGGVQAWSTETCQCEVTEATVLGCTAECSTNYNPEANCDDGSCVVCEEGCKDMTACNFDADAEIENNDLCIFESDFDCNTDCILGNLEEFSTETCQCEVTVVTVSGCTDEAATNYNAAANCDDNTCTYEADCTDMAACNFNAEALATDNTLCVYESDFDCNTNCTLGDLEEFSTETCQCEVTVVTVLGCTDVTATNYDAAANCDDGSCMFAEGCTDVTACNYDENATVDDGSCVTIAAGTISTDDNTTTCSGDGVDDIITATATGNIGSYTYIITDGTATTILGQSDTGEFNLEGAPAGTCLIWGVAHDGSLNAPTDQVADLEGCFELSNSIEVIRQDQFGCTDVAACNYDSAAQCDDNSCEYGETDCPDPCNTILGCTDITGCNYDATANCNDGSCSFPAPGESCITGCTEPCADNYDPDAQTDDGSCNPVDTTCNTDVCVGGGSEVYDFDVCGCVIDVATISGCTDATADNYDATANCDDNSCVTAGCTDQGACNYNPAANTDDNSCEFGDTQCPEPCNVVYGCLDPDACNFEPTANCTDGKCDYTSCLFGSVETTIYYDENGNGMFDGDDELLSGVTVLITFEDGTTIILSSDSNGNISESELPPGDYTATVFLPAGYAYAGGGSDANYSFTIMGSQTTTFGDNGDGNQIPVVLFEAPCPEIDVLVQKVCNEDGDEYRLLVSHTGAESFTVTNNLTGEVIVNDFSPVTIFGPYDFSFVNDGADVSVVITGNDICDPVTETLSSIDCNVTAVELISFEGKVMTEGNLIYWITATEKDVAYYVVEKSFESTDRFEAVDIVKSNGNSNSIMNYELLDRNAQAGMSYYRLVEVSVNGNERVVSDVITLQRSVKDFGIVNVAPVPAHDIVNVAFRSLTDYVEINIFDVTGKLVKSQRVSSEEGLNNVSIDIREFSIGTYFLNLTQGESNETVRIVKD